MLGRGEMRGFPTANADIADRQAGIHARPFAFGAVIEIPEAGKRGPDIHDPVALGGFHDRKTVIGLGPGGGQGEKGNQAQYGEVRGNGLAQPATNAGRSTQYLHVELLGLQA